MSRKQFSRRQLLKMVGVGLAGTALASCKPEVVEKVVKETVVVEKEVEKEVTRVVEKKAPPGDKIVRLLISSWALGEIPFDKTAREFNDANEGVEVKVQTTFEGWDTKVIAQINEGSVAWSLCGILSTDYHTAKWIRSGLIQPMGDYVAASSQEGASGMLDDMIPTVKKAGIFEGKLYGIPYSFENVTFNWRTDYFDAIGVSKAPESWDEWLKVALELKKWGADEEIYPTSFVSDMTTTMMGLLCAASKKPYTDEGLVDWLGDDMQEALTFFKKLVVEEELTPPHGFDGWLDAFYSGKVASVQAQSSRGVWGQRAFGTEKMTTSPIVPKKKGAGSGAPYWGNDLALVNKAPYPQEAVDYLIYTMGPQNVGFQKTVIKTGKTPVYNSIYESVIKGDPQFRTYQWMIDMREDVENAVPLPQTTWVDIQYSAYNKHIVNFTEPGSTMSPEECAQLIYDDVKEEVEKQKTK
ncbi:MAG: extracellular solute-binding protein [Chloroflexota bacterium]|nr:extracellular solute-binding protein [Chloroflexota bacterium]